MLRSYLNGQWRAPTDDGRPLLLRGVRHHMQRTAIQGHPDLLATLAEDTP